MLTPYQRVLRVVTWTGYQNDAVIRDFDSLRLGEDFERLARPRNMIILTESHARYQLLD